MMIISLFVFICCLFFIVFMPWRRQVLLWPAKLKQKFRPAAKQELLRELQGLQTESGSEISVRRLYQALQRYLARVLGGEANALTMDEVLQALRPLLSDQEQARTLHPLFKQVEAVQFGGQSLRPEDWRRTVADMSKILGGLKP